MIYSMYILLMNYLLTSARSHKFGRQSQANMDDDDYDDDDGGGCSGGLNGYAEGTGKNTLGHTSGDIGDLNTVISNAIMPEWRCRQYFDCFIFLLECLPEEVIIQKVLPVFVVGLQVGMFWSVRLAALQRIESETGKPAWKVQATLLSLHYIAPVKLLTRV